MKDFLFRVFYWLNIIAWVRPMVALTTRRHVKGLSNIPRHGELILAANHLSLADPPVLTSVMPRRIIWMTKRELFDIPVFGLMYRMFGCIPVRRTEADLQALRKSREALRKRNVLGMFPEGTRGREPCLQAGEPGTALLALSTGAPVLPTAIWGTEDVKLPRRLFRRTDVHVVFGEPLSLTRGKRIRREDVLEGTERIMRRIGELLPPKYRGMYGEFASKTDGGTLGREMG